MEFLTSDDSYKALDGVSERELMVDGQQMLVCQYDELRPATITPKKEDGPDKKFCK